MTLPAYPVYIISKGRWRTRLTSTSLHRLGIPHYVIVEASQRRFYEVSVDRSATVLVLDPKYQAEYETLDDSGVTTSTGAGPARNFAWDHSIAAGATWHWVMDDNIYGFLRLFRNIKTPVATPTIFYAMETFCSRYTNVVMAGPNYKMFASRKAKMPPFVLNTRIYSCNLIRNDILYRWRGRYNEDTDLSIRILKAGLVTVLFNAFLQDKAVSMVMKGGNTDLLYARNGAIDGRLAMAESIANLHPDVARVSTKWGRPQHHVDYSGFTTKLRRKPGVPIPVGVDNFGMRLERRNGDGIWS